MSDPAWLGYTGAITGIIGAVTGIAGAILGHIAYRRSDQLKALDLRLELRKNVASLLSDANELLPLFDYAQKSKLAVAAAAGVYKSGATEKWVSECDADKAKATGLLEKLPNPEDQYLNFSPSALETKLVEIHSLQDGISRLQKKYEDSLATDDKARAQIVATRVTR